MLFDAHYRAALASLGESPGSKVSVYVCVWSIV